VLRVPPSPAARRPSFGRPRAVRGLDQFDTPPIALAPLFEHEPLLSGLTTVCEPFCGKGNLAIAMRERGLTVFASDIVDRGCPDSTVLDFFAMTGPPPGCDTLITNPAYRCAMATIEHALAIGFRVVALLLEVNFLCTGDRFERLHQPPIGVDFQVENQISQMMMTTSPAALPISDSAIAAPKAPNLHTH
jgi:hypothetical protein